jgi:hypothetical protein
MDGSGSKSFCRRCDAWVEIDHVHGSREREPRISVGKLPGVGLLSGRVERVRGRLELVGKARLLDGRLVAEGALLELLLPGGQWVAGRFRGGEPSTPTMEIALGGSWEWAHGREEMVTAFLTLPEDATLRWAPEPDAAPQPDRPADEDP